jgi:hypothetical protein
MEDKKMVSLINDAKQKLVAQKILNPSVMNFEVLPQDANNQDNFDWRYLSMAAVL